MHRARPHWVRSRKGCRAFDLYIKDVHAKMSAEGRLHDKLGNLDKARLIQAEAKRTWEFEVDEVRREYQHRALRARIQSALEDKKAMLDYIRLALKQAAQLRKLTGIAAVVDSATLMLFEYCNPPRVMYYLVAPVQRLNDQLFEATFFEMQPLPQRRPTVTTLQFVQTTTGTDGSTPWPEMLTELEVTSTLIGLKLNKSRFSLPPSAAKGAGPIPAGLA